MNALEDKRISRPGEYLGPIKGGRPFKLQAGDILNIPANTPHGTIWRVDLRVDEGQRRAVRMCLSRGELRDDGRHPQRGPLATKDYQTLKSQIAA